jgi:hypothetical protein
MGFVRILTNLFNDGMAMAFNVVPKNETYVLPADYYKYTRPFANEMNDNFKTPDKNSFKNMTQGKPSSLSQKSKQSQRYDKAPAIMQPKTDFLESQKIYQNSNR